MDHASVVPRDVSYHLLEEITDGFSEERLLGSGAYGKVYLGIHKNGEKIAVKMLYDMPGLDDEQQFQKEFNNLTKLQHPNIIRLVGYCYEIQKKYMEYNGRMVFAEMIKRALCFEYMHNGSLDKYLFDEYSGPDWVTRYAMIKGICKGLKYLHEELEYPIYHLDLKPANVLLAENLVPKIADFGLSRLFGEEQTQITNTSIGTRGYLPPEYIERNVISNKFDIFSLGVVIIKVMTGPTGYFKYGEMSSQQFIELVHGNWRDRLQATSAYAPGLYSEQVMTCIEIALMCVEADRHKRPSIGDIIDKMNEAEPVIIPRRRVSRVDTGSEVVQQCVQFGEVTEEELRQYDGSNPKKPVLLAIKGQIYDVTKSRMFYGPGGPYAPFSGKDASRALAKMSFDPQDLTGDISGLSPFELDALLDWEYRFMSKYVKVGTVKRTSTSLGTNVHP